MIVFHGSYMAVPAPDVSRCRGYADLGRGFYTTSCYVHAANWCNKFSRPGENGVVSQYYFDESAFSKLSVLRFDAYSEEWLDFVLKCRSGNDSTDYDIVMGGTANDKVFNTVELYSDNLIGKKEAINRLRYEKPDLQICFMTQESIDRYLHYEGSEIL